MRPREREQDPPPPEESSPPPSDPPPRPAGNLSSMVVRPPATSGGDSDYRLGSPPPSSNAHRRDSPPHPDFHRRRLDSPPPFRRRGDSPGGFHRRGSPPAFRRREGRGSPPSFHQPRSHRFQGSPGYVPRAGSISPPLRRPRMDDSHYDPNFDRPAGPSFGRGYRGGRGGGRFRDVSPRNGLGRGGRSFGRGYNVDERGISPVDGEYVHRNDPNLSPREGDWICGNPRCGNLNFARRTYCNNCEEPRFATARGGPIRSPRRGYFTSPLPHGSPPGIDAPPVYRGARRNFNGYRSPPRGWDSTGDPRDFGTGSPLPRRAGRFQDHLRGDNRVEYEDEGRGRGNWTATDEWDNRRDGFAPERRGYDRRPVSPIPRDRWARDRSRSPTGNRLLKGPYMGRERDNRRYSNDSYPPRGRADDPEMRRGPGFRRGSDTFTGRGRGRGRSNADLY